MSVFFPYVCAAQALPALADRVKPAAVFSFNVPPMVSGERLFSSPVLADIFKDERWRERQLFLEAFDVEYRREEEVFEGNKMILLPPEESLLAAAFAHLDRWAPDKTEAAVIVNCWAGKSRSTALALALAAYRRPQEQELVLVNDLLRLRPKAAPNRTIVALADELLQRNGLLLEAVDTHSDVIENRKEIHKNPVRRGPFMAAPLARRGACLP